MRKIIGTGIVEIARFHTPIRTILLQASNSNDGTIFLDLNNPQPIATDCTWELQAGDWLILDDFHGAIYAFASKAGQQLNGSYYQRFDNKEGAR